MKQKWVFIITMIFILSAGSSGICKDADTRPASAAKPAMLSLDDILKHLENRYAAPGFSANFFQTSTLKAMDVTETASGTMMVKRPGMMRWTYEKPDKQVIVTDNKHLWIYRPADNQVTVGSAPVFFGDGKGASILSDIQSLRKKFSVALDEQMTASQEYVLRLVPIDKTYDLSAVLLILSADTFEIVEVVTYNSYQDETRIELSNIQMEQNLNDDQFTFTIPQGTEVVRMEG